MPAPRRPFALVHRLQVLVGSMRLLHHAPPHALILSDGRVIVLAESIGRGSIGEVHRGVLESAWQMRRPVAVKVFDAPPEQEPGEMMQRLGGIARRAACLNHPSVVRVYEVDRTDHAGTAQPFVVMEMVEGEPLSSILAAWHEQGFRVPVDFALVVALRIAEALGAALFTDAPDGGLTQLVHGDLSPRQVLVSQQGDVKVGDFGQAVLRDAVSHVRSRDRLAYTAPEVACGLDPDARADVFSLGVILHEMLVGPRFGPGTGTAEAIRMVRDGRFHSTCLEPNLPRDLRAVLDRALMPNPMQRHPHARSLAFDLRREMLRMGLSDAQTSVRHAVVGWCELRSSYEAPPSRRTSEVVPSPARDDPQGVRPSADDTSPEIRRAKRR
jgi:serine/threonine-protein kinase